MEQTPKTALVLAAGGVFGAYQAGVWKALSDSFFPDLVIGASIGSLNGWMIAGGCSADELVELWMTAGPRLRIRPRVPRHWTHGVLDFSGVESALTELYERYTPRTGVGVVVTDLFRLKPELFLNEEITLRHLKASCAVLGAFDLQRLGGRTYADGGMCGALPLWAAIQSGATRIVTVSPLPAPPLPLRILGSITHQRNARVQAVGPVEILRIEPQRPLGSFHHMLQYRPDRIRDWIEAGERDAGQIKHSLQKCFARE